MVVTDELSEKSSLRRDNRRPQLLDAAAHNFRLQGYTAASMRDIATDSGMKAGSMYYYFPSKVDLLIAVHEEGIRRISNAVKEATMGAADSLTRLQAAMSAHLKVLLDGGEYARVVIRELPLNNTAVRKRLIPLRDKYEAQFTALFDDLPLVDRVSRQHLRLMVLGALNWSQTWYRPGGDSPDEIADAFLEVLKSLVDIKNKTCSG